ncbi:unnamed protein product [Effrenium voratum]|nr:unnamed protein product [Effrenium voratum]
MASAPCAGLAVLLCGLPGCGKDTVGRACAAAFEGAAAMSQDEHRAHGPTAQKAFTELLKQKASPVLVLRNGVDVGDRLPYVLAAKRHGYRVVAVWPAELSSSDRQRRAALALASLAGCYGRLSANGRKGHETLTAEKVEKPAQVCLNFLHMFRAPSAGEVDAVLPLAFLRSDLNGLEESMALAEVGKSLGQKRLPALVAGAVSGSFAAAQASIAAWGAEAARRPVEELTSELTQWLDEQRALPASAAPAGGDEDMKRLQRAAKIRSAVEHMVSPFNLAACRETGSTVTSCRWAPKEDAEGAAPGAAPWRPAWPLSYFCGAPQLRKWGATPQDVMEAAVESSESSASLQEGDKGVLVELLQLEDAELLVSPKGPLPEECLRKLKCP